ncbi:MAG: hypothetical protein N2505_00775 [Endomicrobia bacterium]|nr:hypothetical protein [Endomicrobiia bacterium]
MKNLIKGFLVLFIFASAFAFEDKEQKPKNPHPTGPFFNKREEFIEQKIRILKEEGVITEDEEKDILNNIKEVKEYKKQVWADDKLTKEERENLINKEKNLRQKIRSLLQKAEKHFDEEHLTLQEKEKRFESRIENLLKNKKISEKDAKILKEAHSQLITKEQEIWADDVMTKEEQESLIEEKEKFKKIFFSILKTPKEIKSKFKHKVIPHGCPGCEKEHF